MARMAQHLEGVRTEMSLSPGDPRHGTANGYSNLGCRCDACRKAQTAYMKARGLAGYKEDACACGRPKRVVATKCWVCHKEDNRAEHGTESRYKGGCRCKFCRAAAAAERRRRRHANLAATRAYDREYQARRRAEAAA